MPSEEKVDQFEHAYRFVDRVVRNLSIMDQEAGIYSMRAFLPKEEIKRLVSWYRSNDVPVAVWLFFEMDIFEKAPELVNTAGLLRVWRRSMGKVYANPKARLGSPQYKIWYLLTKADIQSTRLLTERRMSWRDLFTRRLRSLLGVSSRA